VLNDEVAKVYVIILHDFIGQQNCSIYAWQTTDFCWPILLRDKIGQLCRSSDIEFSKWCDVLYVVMCMIG